jgi:hypothetical protein
MRLLAALLFILILPVAVLRGVLALIREKVEDSYYAAPEAPTDAVAPGDTAAEGSSRVRSPNR